MADKEKLIIEVDVDNKKAKSGFDELGNKAQSTGASMFKALTAANLLSSGITAVTSAIAQGFADAVENFQNFETQFTNVQTLLTDTASTEQINALKEGVIDLGIESGQTFEALNLGLFDIVSSGAAAGKEMEVLASATQLATAGAATVDDATKALVATLSSFGDEAGTSQDIAEKFFAAQKRGITNVAQLGTEFNKVAGLAKTLGQSFDVTLAAATSLTNNGAKPTSEAFTELKALLNSVILVQNKLSNESEGVQKALSLQNVKAVGVVEALNQLQTATGGNVVELQRLLGSSEAVNSALALTGTQAQTFQAILADFGNETQRTTNFQDALAIKQETLETNTNRLSRSYEALTIAIGDKLSPGVEQWKKGIAEILNGVTDLIKGNISLIDVTDALAESIGRVILSDVNNGMIRLKETYELLRDTIFGTSETIIDSEQDLFNLSIAAAQSMKTVNKVVEESQKEALRIAVQSFGERLSAQEKAQAEIEENEINHKIEQERIAQASIDEINEIEFEKYKRLIELNRNELETIRLQEEGASAKKIALKAEERKILQNIDSIENRVDQLRNKEHLTAIETATLEHADELILINQEKLQKLYDDQVDSDDDLITEIDDTFRKIEELPPAETSIIIDKGPLDDLITDVGQVVIPPIKIPIELEDNTGGGQGGISTETDCRNQRLAFNRKTNQCCFPGQIYSELDGKCIFSSPFDSSSGQQSPQLSISSPSEAVERANDDIDFSQSENSLRQSSISSGAKSGVQNGNSEMLHSIVVSIEPAELAKFISAKQREQSKLRTSTR